MNIAWYSHYFSPEVGAPSARINDLSRCFINRGHSVNVNTCYPNHPKGVLYQGYHHGLYMAERISEIDVSRYWSYIAPNKGIVKKLTGHVSFMASAIAQSHRNPIRSDVVIGTSPTFFAAMGAATRGFRCKIPFIMEVRDLWPAIFVELGVLKNPFLIRMLEMLELWLYRKATRVVTVTESFRKDLINRGVAPDKVVNIPNGADVDFWQPMDSTSFMRSKLGLENKFVILYIGAHGISHALTRILECAKELKDTSDIHFLFVGDGAEKPELIEYSQRQQLKNVSFHGSVGKEQVRSFYALSDICLVPLRNIPLFDSFIPSKMFEVMAMARPIVASLKGESAGIVEKSGGGLVTEPENVAEIKRSILHLYYNRQLCADLGKKGRQFVCENYSRQALADKYLRTIEGAIEAYER